MAVKAAPRADLNVHSALLLKCGNLEDSPTGGRRPPGGGLPPFMARRILEDHIFIVDVPSSNNSDMRNDPTTPNVAKQVDAEVENAKDVPPSFRVQRLRATRAAELIMHGGHVLAKLDQERSNMRLACKLTRSHRSIVVDSVNASRPILCELHALATGKGALHQRRQGLCVAFFVAGALRKFRCNSLAG
ncbi:hypothetical protein BDV95DRAFT_598037 [Massariosphaeria phaeospora]|uniref:Uncharacterized protein n=1 Tax=Massariosphaeria phaeospora TaxID=100035 RepID=A0A7C8M4C8_9PLEO|nr:hypothetical protein BDV95DRAFT_598037 [Massariosphaeria phaeospora]